MASSSIVILAVLLVVSLFSGYETAEAASTATPEEGGTTGFPETSDIASTLTPEAGGTTGVPETTEAGETTGVPETTEAANTATPGAGGTTGGPETTEAANTAMTEETTGVPETTEAENTAMTEETTGVPETTEAASMATPGAGGTTGVPETTEAANTAMTEETTGVPETTEAENTAMTEETTAEETTGVPETTEAASMATPGAGGTTGVPETTEAENTAMTEETTGFPETTEAANTAMTEETTGVPETTEAANTAMTEETTGVPETTEAENTAMTEETTGVPETTEGANTAMTEETTGVPETTEAENTAMTEETTGVPETTEAANTAMTEETTGVPETTDAANTAMTEETTGVPETTEAANTAMTEETTGVPETTKAENTAMPEETTGVPETTEVASMAPTTHVPGATTPASTDQTSPPTIKPIHCQNGGTFTGTICKCTSGFHGDVCQFLEESVALDKIERLVKIGVVIDDDYDPNYDNTSSEEYREFVNEFTEKMKAFYTEKNLENFHTVVVTTVRPVIPQGRVRRSASAAEQHRLDTDATAVHRVTPKPQGIAVSHNVVLLIRNNGDSEKEYQEELKVVTQALHTLASCKTGCVYNVTQTPSVVETTVNLNTLCGSLVKDPDLAVHYKAVTFDHILVCVTRCDSRYGSDWVRCYNDGACKVFKDVGAICNCRALEATWYLGSNCRQPIRRTAFYAGLVVTLVCLLAALAGLTAYVTVNKKEQMRKKDMKTKLVNNWLNDEFEWSRSDKLSTGTFNAGHLNPSFPYQASLRTPPTRQHADYRQSGRSSPAVSMCRLDDASLHRDGLPPEHDQAMRIHRPQIRSSWDA